MHPFGSGTTPYDRLTLTAFLMLVLIGGSNAVAVRFSNFGLPPFFGAAARFALAALVFWIVVLVRRVPLPRGRTLAVTFLFGALSIGVSYAFLYWAILSVPPGLAMIVLALSPLMTFFFAFLHGLERFQWRGLLGAVVALAGIVVGVGGASTRAPLVPVLAITAGAAAIAEASVLLKRNPRTDPIATNAIALITGAGVLAATSLFAHERWSLPADPSTWGAFIYLVAAGTVVLFFLYLFILDRWSASATSYSFLLFPLVTIVLSSLITGEIITPIFLLGTTLVLMGVWLGALARPGTSARGREGEQEGQGTLAAEGVPDRRS